jgi:drug/metabolite transporter (DMT)-like permease
VLDYPNHTPLPFSAAKLDLSAISLTAAAATLYTSCHAVAFVQMLKAFTPVSTMLFAFAFKLERPTARLIAAVGLITLGVLSASYGEGNFSFVGVTAMVLSMLCEGLRLVMMQSLVAKRSFQPIEALMYLAPAASFWVLLIAGSTEALQMRQEQHLADLAAHPGYVLASAAAGFGVNAAAMAVISLASALTLKVLGICKDIGLVMYGVVVLGEHVGQSQMAGYFISLLGLVWYNAIKACGTAVAAGAGAASGAAALPNGAAASGPAGLQATAAAGRRRSTVGAGAVSAAAAAAGVTDGQAAAAVKAAVVRR